MRGEHKYDLVRDSAEIDALLGTLAIRLEDLQREARRTHEEIKAHERKSKGRFVALASLVAVCCIVAGLIYWQVSRQRSELERTRQLQQAMLVRMLPANDPLRADQLRQNLDDAQTYRRLLMRELAPQFGIYSGRSRAAAGKIKPKSPCATPSRDAKEKAQQLIAAGRLTKLLVCSTRQLRPLPGLCGSFDRERRCPFAAFRLGEAEEAYRQAANLVDEKAEPAAWMAAQAKVAESPGGTGSLFRCRTDSPPDCRNKPEGARHRQPGFSGCS